MNRPDFVRSCFSASLLLLLASCGAEQETDFRAQLGGTWVPFENVESQVLGTESEFLATCGVQDPDPNRLGDERRLCVVLELTLGQLSSQSEGRAFPIRGQARFTEAHAGWRPAFTPEPTHDAGIRNVWAVLYCAQAPRPDVVTQDIRGQLLLTRAAGSRREGRVQLSISGGLAGSACGVSSGESVFDFPFKADY
jgi:hypothetical protein